MQQVTHLIDFFIPTHYQLALDIDRQQRHFAGQVRITGETTQADTPIKLHVKDLTITSATIDGQPASVEHNEDEISLHLPTLSADTHTITLAYEAAITDSLHGLYPCYYQHDGAKKELLMTQFESHHAREVFPCVDEPAAKATFDITVTTEPGITVLSNMPVQSQQEADGRLITTFTQTPRMSTYLVALVMGELQHITGQTKDGVEVSVWATPAQAPASLDFALEHAIRSIEFFNEYFDTPYPLPKSDHVAVPDFSSGAMENWGLITYRESALLADPTTTTIADKQYIATVISHELSHQWFGNLVTMKWWDNLWLNESFANMMEYLAVDAIHPEWHVWTDFCNHEGALAFGRDAIDGVQPVQTAVHHPDEISTLFDGAIVYAKGGRLLYMLMHWLGEAAFRTGLQAYFDTHAYGNAEGDDLWHALSQASGRDVAALMNHWIRTPGYPVVTASHSGSQLMLEQQRFFIGPHAADDTTWQIPLHSSSPAIPALLTTQRTVVECSLDEPLLLNHGNVSHFITQYDDILLERLLGQVRRGELSVVDRSLLLTQQLLLARSDRVSSASLLTLLDAYRNETDEHVWSVMSSVVAHLKLFVEPHSAAEQALRQFVGQLAQQSYDRLGWSARPGEPENDTRLRSTIIAHMLYSEQPAVIAEAQRRYAAGGLLALDSELRSLIASSVVRHSQQPQPLIDELLAHYRATASSDLRQDIASAVTSTRDAASIRKLLALMMDTETVRTQDTVFWFVYLLRNRDARDATWQWLQDNWQWIEEHFGSDKSFDYFPRYAGNILASRQQLSEYQRFFTPLRKEPALTRVIDMGITDITARVELIERDSPAVVAALTKV